MVQCDVDTIIHLCDSRLHNRLPPCRAISQVCSHRNAQRTRKNEGRGWDKRVIVKRERKRERERERESTEGVDTMQRRGIRRSWKKEKMIEKSSICTRYDTCYTIRYTKISYGENIRCLRIKINYYTRDNSVSMALSHENRAKMVYKSLYARTKGGWLVV